MLQAAQVQVPVPSDSSDGDSDGPQAVRIRVGIHSGRVMSGVVGHLRKRYCLFGDAVNTTARIESTGLAGMIQVSEATYERLAGDVARLPFVCRGPVHCKGKGDVTTYLLNPQQCPGEAGG